MFFSPAPDALPQQQGIKHYFLVQSFSFASVGIDPTSLERTTVSYFLAWFPLMSILTLCLLITLYAKQYITDLYQVTDALSPFWQSILSVMKLLYFMWKKDKIVGLVRKIWSWNLQANEEELKILLEENSRDTKFSLIFYICVFTTGVMALVSPFVISAYYYLQGLGFRENLEPPLKAAYFVDLNTHFGYAIAFFWDAFGIYCVINGNLAIDSLFSWFMHNVSAQFRILNLHFRADANKLSQNVNEKEFQKLIIKRIKHHRRVIELAQNFNDVYMIIVFIKSTISFIQISFLAYQFAKGREMSAQIFHLFFLISVSMQLILYCHGGQRINDESISVAFTIYDCFKWHDLSIETKKLLLLPLMRAQKPCLLTGVFFVADLSLFLWVYKMAGSFITMLLTLEEKGETQLTN